MPVTPLEFEKSIVELEKEVESARLRIGEGPAAQQRCAELEARLAESLRRIYADLTPWQRVLVARHKDRPHAFDYVEALTTGFTEVHGDRGFGDDQAVICGYARFEGRPVGIVAQQKGKDTKDNVRRNFGMMHPEGYRKAMRVMREAERFNMPIFVLIDTPGAYPGIGAEERGQAEAIARNIQDMFTLKVPVIALVIGEGASGGALGVGVGDRVLMMENSWYCVISPEGCSAILWRDHAMKARAAEALKLTADDLLKLGVVDESIPEPAGGAHRYPAQTFANVRPVLARHLAELGKLTPDELIEKRFQKYRAMGVFQEA